LIIDHRGHAEFGNLVDATKKTTSEGIMFYFTDSLAGANYRPIYGLGTSTVNFYGCTFLTDTSQGGYSFYLAGVDGNNIYNTIFQGGFWQGINLDVYNVEVQDSAYAWWYISSGTFEKITSTDTEQGIYFATTWTPTVRNFIMKNIENAEIKAWKITTDGHMIDCELEKWDTTWTGTPAENPGKIYRQNSFDLNVTDEDGSAISSADIDINSTSSDTLCFNNKTTTDADGGIETQTITVGYYNITGGDTIYDCNPYILTISEPTYQTYNTTISFTEKTALTIALKDTLGSGTCNISYDYTVATNTYRFWGTHDDGTNITFQDLYDCDDTDASFDCIETDDLSSYTIKCDLEIGDGTTETWFACENTQVSFISGLGTYFLDQNANSNVRFGSLIDADAKTTENGCQIFVLEDTPIKYLYFLPSTTGSTEIYDTSFSNLGNRAVRVQLGFGASAHNIKVYNSKFSGLNYVWFYGGGIDMYNVDITDTGTAIKVTNTPDYAEDLRLWGGNYYLNIISGDSTFKNPKGRGADTKGFHIASYTGDFYLINPDFDRWDIYFQATVTGYLHRQYELDIKVIDNTSVAGLSQEIIGATVNMNSSNSNPQCFNNVTTTNSSGMIDTQTITTHTYTQVTSQTVNLTECNPYRFIITADGYQTLNFTANITDKTDWTLSMPVELNHTLLAYYIWNYIARDVHGVTMGDTPVTPPTDYFDYVASVWNYTYRYIHGTIP